MIWKEIHRAISVIQCPACGRLGKKSRLICGECYSKAVANMNESRRWQGSHAHFYLWPWAGVLGEVVGPLIKSLKSQDGIFFWRWIASEMIAKNIEYLNSIPRPIFIPAPSSSRQSRDHAFGLALELSRQAGGEFYSVLRKPLGQRQRGKGLRDRLQVQVERDENFSTSNLSGGTVILIDDVLTTGATASACYRALGEPRDFAIWSVAYRPR